MWNELRVAPWAAVGRVTVLGWCVVLLGLGAAACRRAPSEGASPKRGPVAVTARGRDPQGASAWRPLSALREQMKLIEVYTADMRRRVEQGVDLSSPARVVANLAARLPLNGAPTSMRAAALDLQYRATQLAGSQRPRAAYGALVAGCVECHRNHALALVRRVEALALPPPADAR